jgi:restriction system protein
MHSTRVAAADDLLEISEQRPVYGARGNVLSYEIVVKHRGLNKHRVVKARDSVMLNAKVVAQVEEWAVSWHAERERRSRIDAREADVRLGAANKEAHKRYLEDQKESATLRTSEARVAHAQIDAILQIGLGHVTKIDWAARKKGKPFALPRPVKRKAPPVPAATPVLPQRPPTVVASEPKSTDAAFVPELNLWDRLFSSSRVKKEQIARSKFQNAHRDWTRAKLEANSRDEETRADWEREVQAASLRDDALRKEHEVLLFQIEQEFSNQLQKWESARAAHAEQNEAEMAALDALRNRYEARDTGAIEEVCDMILADSTYPDFCPHEFEVNVTGDAGVGVVDYKLPAPDDLPTLVEVKYVSSSDSFVEKNLSDSKRGDMYDRLLYQITLRTLFELFTGDNVEALTSIVFNGFVTAVDKSTGKEVTACVLSVHASRESFLSIDLAKVEPKLCFRQLKGVGSSKLHSVAAVAPIMTVDRNDSRFVVAREIADRLDEGYNLAAMDWEDFEHLIREIFGREFSSSGGEVRVTQASRDGGVDAIAFDPDPIRGGKIVIQAKRYTHTVGVAAVRDLFGTVMNEGATKGILVTTADYGPDAYEFAKGKPLSLLNGGNLLSLLQKHGVQARIDLVEARRLASESSVS